MRRTVEAFQRMVRLEMGLPLPAGANPSPLPATWPSAPMRWRQHCHLRLVPVAPSPRPTNGPATNRLAGTRACASLLKRMGKAFGQAPASGRHPHRRPSSVISLTAPKPRARGRGMETPQQAAERAKFDLALVAVLSERRSEAVTLPPSAGMTAAAASPSSAPRPTWKRPAPCWSSPPPSCGPWTPSDRQGFSII